MYVVPVGTMFPEPLDGVTVNNEALHAVTVWAVTNGLGFTTNGTVNASPAQLAALTGITE